MNATITLKPASARRGWLRTSTPHMRYRLNSPEVVAETLDGEALIVHLGTGAYYSCRGSGEAIWAQLIGGRTVAETAAALATHFDPAAPALILDVERFLAELLQEDLLVQADVPATAPPSGSAVSESYEPPSLNKYTDMQDLLALDPVHDVDAAEGWPAAKPGP